MLISKANSQTPQTTSPTSSTTSKPTASHAEHAHTRPHTPTPIVTELRARITPKVPNTLHFGLNPIQRAILYTLALSGSADSVREFTTRLIRHALTTAAETNLKDLEGTEINAIRTGDFDTGATLLEETLLPAIQSKVQYHLTKLETDGFIHKHNIGQSTGIELTRAGSVYTGTQDFDQDWKESTFKNVCAVLSEAHET